MNSTVEKFDAGPAHFVIPLNKKSMEKSSRDYRFSKHKFEGNIGVGGKNLSGAHATMKDSKFTHKNYKSS